MLEIFLVAVGLAIIFGVFGFTRISVGFMAIARIVFFVLIVLIVLALLGNVAGIIVI
jgi:uncharacterized membrane protein YtjA (UPF0391 family)